MAEGRAKREAKSVERLTIESNEKDPGDFKIAAGAGKKMGEVENIVFKIGRLNAQSEELKQLHRLCFGKVGAKSVVKKNLREFSGFVADDLTAEKAKKLALVLKHDLKLIKGMLDTCDLSPGGTKAEAAARLIDFLEAPHESGKKSLVEKAGQKRKLAEKKAAKKASPAKAKAKGKVAAAQPKQERAKTAYMLYCDSRRDKVKAENPDAGFGELNKILAEKWKGISDERKKKYEAQAAALKEELAAKQSKSKPAAEPAAKRAKTEPVAKKAKKAPAQEEAEEEVAEEEENEAEEAAAAEEEAAGEEEETGEAEEEEAEEEEAAEQEEEEAAEEEEEAAAVEPDTGGDDKGDEDKAKAMEE